MRKITCVITLVLAVVIVFPAIPVNATRLDDLKKQQADSQSRLNAANSTVSNLKNRKSAIESEISELDAKLIDMMTAVSLLEDQIDDTKAKIIVTKDELEKAKAVEQKQYEAMKLRIKYMYEKGNLSYVEVLTEAKSFSEIVNKADYIGLLYDYDRRMLEEYQAAKKAVEETKIKLEQEEEQLEIDLLELEAEKQELDDLLQEKKAEASDYDTQIARAKQEAATYKAMVKQQNAEIKQIEQEEARKAAEAKRLAEEKKAADKKRLEEEEKNNNENDSGQNNEETNREVDNGQENTPREAPKEETAPKASTAGSALGAKLAAYGLKFVGNPYVYGGTSLTNGCDCSGFVYAVCKDCGVNVPKTSSAQRNIGIGVSYSEAQPGDIICYPGHVGIYIGGGQIVHASTPSGGIKVGSATYTTILTVRRLG